MNVTLRSIFKWLRSDFHLHGLLGLLEHIF